MAAKDLSPPAVCAAQLNALIELLQSPDASMLPEEEAAGRLLGPIVDAVVDPLVAMCKKSADALQVLLLLPSVARSTPIWAAGVRAHTHTYILRSSGNTQPRAFLAST